MRRKLAFLTATLAMAAALAVPMAKSSATEQSCMGQCKRAYNACINTARSTSEAAQCNKSYQGCISSCK